MSNIELLEMRELFNYDLSKSMINVSKTTLNVLAENYGIELNAINDEIYRNITVSLLSFLKENNVATDETEETLSNNALALRSTLQEKTQELIEISSLLGKIMDEKMNHQLLEQIKQDGSSNDIKLNEYVEKTANAGKVLSTSSFPNIEREIDTYNKKLIEDLKIDLDSTFVLKLQSRLDNYKKIYLYRLAAENKIMFGNFANLVSTTGVYLGNYAKSVDEVLGLKNVNTDFDELGVPKERKSLIENLDYARQLYESEQKRMI